MKLFIFISATCLLGVLGAPDLLGLGDPKAIANLVAESVGQTTPTPEPSTTFKPALSTSSQGTVEDRTRLLQQLFGTGYNKKVNPDSVKLDFGLSLIDFRVIDTRNVMESYGWLKMMWKDERLKWNKEEYGGCNVLRLESSEIWKPDVTLYNSADPVNMVNCWHSNVLIYSNGEILWVPPCKMTSQCAYTFKKQPYGEQTCVLKFGSWTFDGQVLDLQLYNKTAAIDLSDLSNSSGFDIVSTSAQRNDRYYSCCIEPYPDLTFNITMKRVPGEELFNRL